VRQPKLVAFEPEVGTCSRDEAADTGFLGVAAHKRVYARPA
jgi:hypothetical protein